MIGGINWVIIVILVIVFLIVMKVRHMRHRLSAVIVILLLLFFYITAAKLFADTDVDLKTFDGIVKAGKVYFSWIIYASGNARLIAGNAVKMDWVGEGSSTQNKTDAK